MAASFAKLKETFIFNFIEGARWKYITNGLMVTLEVTFFALLLGIVIGVIVAMIRSSYDQMKNEMQPGPGKVVMTALNAVARFYLTVIRGTPVVVQLLIGYFVVFISTTNTVLVASLVFGINSGAYITEIIRGGIMSIDPGQFEAGRSIGFTYIQTMRFIIIPQAFKNVLPALANEFIALHRADGPDQGRRRDPRPHFLGLYAAFGGGRHLPGPGGVLQLAGREAGKEAQEQ